MLIVVIAVLAHNDNSTPSATPATTTEASTYPTDSVTTSAPSYANTPTASVPPPDLVQTPDSYGVNCSDGYHRSGQSGWASNSGRGTTETSCLFANNVLQAYWNTYPSPSRDAREVVAGGTVPCGDVNANAGTTIPCSGNDFIMTCVANGDDPWITCTGGNDAKVYLY
ncbi:hypothetical protein A5707_12600 [Mycobacterium kyorinense]|uniref:Uncharacterized protein n=1 Tax=Mycobacterium kyorinense TaxID=487514 RepID=A0A1A2ZSU0_9MYCO|nr:hypothetical protein [Mycobacterium kyorinense]OBI52151.1 hypothetical protein A5707_12600 [Mycobacterium kyorinense]